MSMLIDNKIVISVMGKLCNWKNVPIRATMMPDPIMIFGILIAFYFYVNTHGGLWKLGKYEVVLEIFDSKAESSIVINPPGQKQSNLQTAKHIPIWFKATAKNWSQGKMSDDEFMQAVQYLTKQGILNVPYYNSPATSTQSLLSWIRTSASAWSDGKISDDEFVNALKHFNFG